VARGTVLDVVCRVGPSKQGEDAAAHGRESQAGACHREGTRCRYRQKSRRRCQRARRHPRPVGEAMKHVRGDQSPGPVSQGERGDPDANEERGVIPLLQRHGKERHESVVPKAEREVDGRHLPAQRPRRSVHDHL
jgi:hypothetical protein